MERSYFFYNGIFSGFIDIVCVWSVVSSSGGFECIFTMIVSRGMIYFDCFLGFFIEWYLFRFDLVIFVCIYVGNRYLRIGFVVVNEVGVIFRDFCWSFVWVIFVGIRISFCFFKCFKIYDEKENSIFKSIV